MPVEETWTTRDLPVLETIVRLDDQQDGGFVGVEDVERETGFDRSTVQRALKALDNETPPFFAKVEGSMTLRYEMIWGVSGHARRTVQAWPSPESLADRLVAQLQRAADAAEDEETSGRLRRTAAWFGSAGRDILVSVIAQTITRGTS